MSVNGWEKSLFTRHIFVQSLGFDSFSKKKVNEYGISSSWTQCGVFDLQRNGFEISTSDPLTIGIKTNVTSYQSSFCPLSKI